MFAKNIFKETLKSAKVIDKNVKQVNWSSSKGAQEIQLLLVHTFEHEWPVLVT